jgi:hypothetical protein
MVVPVGSCRPAGNSFGNALERSDGRHALASRAGLRGRSATRGSDAPPARGGPAADPPEGPTHPRGNPTRTVALQGNGVLARLKKKKGACELRC